MDNRTLAIALVSVLCILVIFIVASNSSKKMMHGKPRPHNGPHGHEGHGHEGHGHEGHGHEGHGPHASHGAGGLNPNLVVFLRSGCGYCDKQKKELEHTPFNYVACGPVNNIPSTGTAVNPPVDCSTITGFPTWYNMETHAVMPGFKTLAQLQSL